MRLDLKWQAILEDGGMVSEDDMPYGELFSKQLRLREFRLIDHYPWKSTKSGVIPPRLFFTIHLQGERRLVYRKRIETVMATDGGKGLSRRTIIVGWQETLAGQNLQCLCLIQEWTGQILMLPRFKAGEEIVVSPLEKEHGLDPRDLEVGG